MTEDELLSMRFENLASAAHRHLIELVALHPRTRRELYKHFDYRSGQQYYVVERVCALNFVTLVEGPARYDYDPRGLAAVRKWVERIQSIQAGDLTRASSSS
jgi:hypothetical protein